MRQITAIMLLAAATAAAAEQDSWKPYSAPCVERENVFEFTEKPKVKNLGNDKYEITFAVKGNCDVTVGIVDSADKVVRHLGSGVLGANAPGPFQKNSLKQTIYWNGKDDLDEYHKTPEKLKVRVMLGLKPEFDKRLGGTSPYNLPGMPWGLAADEQAVYVFTVGGWGRIYVRKFDHDGRYMQSLVPHPANLPEERLSGMGFVEYERGQKAVHGPVLYETTANNGSYLPGIYLSNDGGLRGNCQPAAIGGKLYFTDMGDGAHPAMLYTLFTDGGRELAGAKGMPVGGGAAPSSRLAATPDGKWLFLCGLRSGENIASLVLRRPLAGAQKFERLIDKFGSDNQALNNPTGLDCDAQGRLYVADNFNNRVQIFSTEGKWLKTVPCDHPLLVQVHRKTGAVYVLHAARLEGQSVARLTKFSGFQDLREELHADMEPAACLALDSGAVRPRFWLNGGFVGEGGLRRELGVRIWEEDGKSIKKIRDFWEDVRKEDGPNLFGAWSGGIKCQVACDPVRERVFYKNSICFDLVSGRLLGCVSLPGADDVAFDKRGYMHCHLNPEAQSGVGRLDPAQEQPYDIRYYMNPLNLRWVSLREVPYDYGEESAKRDWKGILPVKDQPGFQGFQNGIGVNMRGDVAEVCRVCYVPKMEELGFAEVGGGDRRSGDMRWQAARFNQQVAELQKSGEAVYFIHRRPGIPLAGDTIWTFDRTGELRDESAVVAGKAVNGVQMDEDGRLYFANARTRMFNGKLFLAGQGGTYGAPDDKQNVNPFTGTLIKTAGRTMKILQANAPVGMEDPPQRPPDLHGGGNQYGSGASLAWVEGAEWLYAGASPIVNAGCICPTMRFHTDWYKRTFVPEAYRHSIGVVDTAGNLILHIGRYGNLDSGDGPKSRIPVGGDGIAVTFNEMVSATDNYLCFEDYGERLVVLRLNYHAEETVGIQ